MDNLPIRSRSPLTLYMKKVREFCVTEKDGSCGDSFTINQNDSTQVKILTVVLVGKGCQWARKAGGCSMCGFYSVTSPLIIPAKNQLFNQFVFEMNKYKEIDENIHLLIYTSGSFLDDDEITIKEQEKILKFISKDQRIIQVDLESLPRFINEVTLNRIKQILGKTKFGISIGLESANETIRNYIIHKDYFSNNQLKNKAKLVKKYGDLKLNIILKPPLLTEREAIDDVLMSVKFAEELKADFIYIAGCNVQKSTLNHHLWKKGLYKPPYLWSLYEIAKKTKSSNMRIVFGGFYDYPSPIAQASNCELCNKSVINSLSNVENDISEETCDCKEVWRNELLNTDKQSLKERITGLYEILNQENFK